MGIRRVLAGAALGAVGAALLALPAAAVVPADPYPPAPSPVGLGVSSTVVGPGATVVVTGRGYASTTTITITTSVVAGFGRVTADAGIAPLGALLAPTGTRAAGPRRFAAAGCVDSCVVTTNSAGVFSTDLTLSRTGTNLIRASGLDPNGNILVQTTSVVVAATGGSGVGGGSGTGGGGGSGSDAGGVGGLPDTGADLRWPVVLGGLLVLFGGGAVVAGRRRKHSGVSV